METGINLAHPVAINRKQTAEQAVELVSAGLMALVVVNAHLEAQGEILQEVPGAAMDMTGMAVIATQEEALVEELILVAITQEEAITPEPEAAIIQEVARTRVQVAEGLIREAVTAVAVILEAIIAWALQEAVVIPHQLATTRQQNHSLFLNQYNSPQHPRL